MKPLIISVLVLLSFGQATTLAQAPSLAFSELAEETTVKTASGATFLVPRGWHLARTPALIVAQEPQRELALAFVELAAPAVEDAVAQAWRRWQPDFARTVRMTTKPPPSGGWDEIAQIVYETSADERRVVVASARRKDKTFYIVLIDGAVAALERRGAQMNMFIGSLKVAGREEEDLVGRKAHRLDPARADRLLAFAEQARTRAGLPGVALAVVQGGSIVLERGLGVRELGKPEAVTPSTLFMIGSMTKPLTSLLIARLVDQHKLSWDTPVTTLLPSFALGDPEITRKVTMAHTMCACTGLPRWDMEFLFEWNNSTPDSRLALLRTMKPTTGFGETFQYSNLMVAAGGYVAALTATGNKDLRKGYVDAMTAEVLGPIGMTSTVLDLNVARTRERAHPHGRTVTFEPEPLPLDTELGVDSVMPAGGAWSNVRDISRWLMLELGRGRIDGQQVVSEANVLERRKPRVSIAPKVAYGLALIMDESRGLQKISHNGGTLGFSADATFFPDHDLGLVVLTNAAGGALYTNAIRRRLIELLFDAEEEAERQFAFGTTQIDTVVKRRLAETRMAPDPAFVEPLLGTWTTQGLGDIRIARKGDTFVFDAGEWTSSIGEHRDPSGTRRLILTSPPLAGLTFWPQENNGTTGLLFETAQQKYWFERVTR